MLGPDSAAEIIIVRCKYDHLGRSPEINSALLKPVADQLRAGTLSTSTPRLLIHVFSNGGGVKLTSLVESLLSSPPPSAPSSSSADASSAGTVAALPARAIVFDSCPGYAGYVNMLRAFTAHMQSPILRYLAYIPLSFWYLFRRLALRGKPDVIAAMRDKLNDPKLLPEDAQRLYLYSRTDLLIDPKCVEAHANDAREKLPNAQIKLREFEGSAHVAHAKKYPEEYWTEVKSLWQRAMSSAEAASKKNN
jgi:pimeloyl-ACP methyl ester carboxylesterase